MQRVERQGRPWQKSAMPNTVVCYCGLCELFQTSDPPTPTPTPSLLALLYAPQRRNYQTIFTQLNAPLPSRDSRNRFHLYLRQYLDSPLRIPISSYGDQFSHTESRRSGSCKHGPRPGMSTQQSRSTPTIANKSCQLQRTQAIHVLDLKYQDTTHQTNLVVKDEEARRLKLRVVVLRDEAATLRDQLADKDSRIRKLSKQYDDIRVQLDQLNQTCINQETQLRLQARQQSELKVRTAAPCTMRAPRQQCF